MTTRVGIAGKELIVRRRVHVNAAARLVYGVIAHERLTINRGRHVATRIQRQNVPGDRIDRRLGDLVAGERRPAGREVQQRRAKARKIAKALGVGRHSGRRGDSLAVLQALVVAEEQHSILLDRAADGAAELVLLERLDLR